MFDQFRGLPVVVFIKSLHISEQDEASITSGSMIAPGIYLSKDDEFLYLGNEAGELTEIIKLEDVARISLDTVTKEEENKLSLVKKPDNEDEYN